MIKVEFLNDADKDKMGVYRLWIGFRYYIGATKHLGNRADMHLHKIRSSADPNWKRGKNSPTLIREHLDNNPHIEVLYMDLLEVVDTEETLVTAEQDWFNISSLDPNCINFRMIAYRKVGDKKIRPNNIAPWVPRR